jgi:hypothetical protein
MRRYSILCILIVLAATPVRADQVLNIFRHSDEMKMMGHTTPAQDVNVQYWFGPHGIRYDDANTSVITRLDTKKFYIVHPQEKTYSTIDLPFDFKSLVGPEMAPMMDQMMSMMAPTVTVTPSDRTGEYAGFRCKWYRIDVSMRMMQMSIDSCNSDHMPIDYERYAALANAQAEMSMNSQWIKDMTAKAPGFPVRSETTMTMGGKSSKGWQELKSVEEKDPPHGFYEPPADFREVKFDPMKQQQGSH